MEKYSKDYGSDTQSLIENMATHPVVVRVVGHGAKQFCYENPEVGFRKKVLSNILRYFELTGYTVTNVDRNYVYTSVQRKVTGTPINHFQVEKKCRDKKVESLF